MLACPANSPNVLAGQGVQLAPDQPDWPMKLPAGHGEQLDAMGDTENQPAAQATHALADDWPGNPLLVPALTTSQTTGVRTNGDTQRPAAKQDSNTRRQRVAGNVSVRHSSSGMDSSMHTLDCSKKRIFHS